MEIKHELDSLRKIKGDKIMEKTDEVLAEGIEGFFSKLMEASEVVSTKLVEVAPEVAEGLLTLVRAKGAFELVIAFLMGGVVLYSAFKVFPATAKIQEKQCEYDLGAEVLYAIAGLVYLILSSIIIPCILSFYNWISVFYPEGAVALRALQAVGFDL